MNYIDIRLEKKQGKARKCLMTAAGSAAIPTDYLSN
jgi:hypothetical protein